MEKLVISKEVRAHRTARRSRYQVLLPAILVLSATLFVAWLGRQWMGVALTAVLPARWFLQQPQDVRFSYWEVEATRHLLYHQCFDDELQCARLELPMDYFNGSTNANISLAVIRMPAVVPVTDPSYGGAVVINPGGPGGSGVDFIFRVGRRLRDIVDEEGGKHFDIIAFDPRGVGYTLPLTAPFFDPIMEQTFSLRFSEEGMLGSSDAVLGRLWSMASAKGQSCSLPPPHGQPDLKKYLSTASVARDMVSLVEAHGEWRHMEAARILRRTYSSCHGSATAGPIEVPEHLRHQPGQEKLLYWGFSYGTYLGQTFASMFPDRVGRVVVDGVVDPYDYKKSLWYDNLVDTEKTMQSFYDNCARVRWPACALANQTGETSADGVEARAKKIIDSLYHNPLPVVGVYPEVIEYSDVKNLLFASLYAPIASFPGLAALLSDIERGDGSRFAQLLRPQHEIVCPSTSIANERLPGMAPPSILRSDATLEIACSDGDEQSWLDRAGFEQYYQNLTKLSPSMGPLWSILRLHCIHYTIRPQYRFEGPWEGNTSHPLLLIGNTADPVTPAIYAVSSAKRYPGSVALIQDSPGHCSASAPSVCTVQHVRRYFQTGELPAENTTCSVDLRPFDITPAGLVEGSSAEVQRLRENLLEIDAAMYAVGGGFLPTIPQRRSLAMFGEA